MKRLSIFALAFIGILIIGLYLFRMNMHADSKISEKPSFEIVEKQLPIPPVLEDLNKDPNQAEFHLNAQKSTTEFIKGKPSETLGYNGSLLGPVIRVKKGEEVTVHVENQLEESTTFHWHGMELPGEMDGGPHSGIEPSTTWVSKFTVDQPASTLWYHPHLMHKTGEQVYKGLAGLVYIDDEESQKLKLPNRYGVDDIPIILQDRRMEEDGQLSYLLERSDVMHGLQGNVVLINGAIKPYFNVPASKVRLRALNGSNAREYNLSLNNLDAFWQIGSDGGLLESPVKLKNLKLGAGERAEIIVDFSSYKKGDVVHLKTDDYAMMEFRVSGKKGEISELPDSLAAIPRLDPSTASTEREFILQGMGAHVNINGKQMDMDRIDEQIKVNSTEIWTIKNEATGMMGMPHPFHAHGTQFQVLDRDGSPPPLNERGWKDTIMIQPGETVRVIAKFRYKGIYMYHCHILEHEDAGMMGQFSVN